MSKRVIKLSRILPYSMIDNAVLIDETLSPIDKVVFCVLCVHAGIESRQCVLKVKTIAREANCSERSVQNSLKTLEERGIIERAERFKEGSQVSSNYQVIGREAFCYTGCNTCTPPRTTCTRGAGDARGGCTTCTQNEKSLNDIKDSLTGEALLPEPENFPVVFEDGQPVEPPKPDDPEEVYSPSDAPAIMRPTAELFLYKTGRKGLTWEEISALRELSASQVPARVQKEIDTAVKRFLKRGQALSELTLNYIAGSLSHQPTRGKKRKIPKSKPLSVPECTDEQAEAEMAEIEALQAKFDEEARAHGF